MAKTNVDLPTLDGNLFLPVPVVLLAELISEAVDLGRAYPEILGSIEEDQNRLGLAKKQLRAECSDWRLRQTPALPGMDGEPLRPLARIAAMSAASTAAEGFSHWVKLLVPKLLPKLHPQGQGRGGGRMPAGNQRSRQAPRPRRTRCELAAGAAGVRRVPSQPRGGSREAVG